MLSVVKAGKGPPIVFLHGLWGGGDYFRTIGFKADGESYFIDQLGFGGSDKPDNASYSLDEHAQNVAEIIPDNSLLIAHSFGCLIALRLSKNFPQKVKKLFLISPPLFRDRTEATGHLQGSTISRLMITKPFLAMLACKLGCSTNILGWMSPLFFSGNTRKFIGGCTQHTWNSFRKTFANLMLQKKGEYQKVFDRIPTAIVYGENDRYISREYINMIKGKKLEKKVILDVGHSLLFTKLSEVEKLI